MPTEEEFLHLRTRVDGLERRVSALEPAVLQIGEPTLTATPGAFRSAAILSTDKPTVVNRVQIIAHASGVPIAVSPVDWKDIAMAGDSSHEYVVTGVYPAGGVITSYLRYYTGTAWINGPAETVLVPKAAPPLTLSLKPGVDTILATWELAPGSKAVRSIRAGRNGTDNTGYGPWPPAGEGVLGPDVRSLTFEKLNPVEYEIWVEVTYTDGTTARVTGRAKPTGPVPDPNPDPDPEPPLPGARRIPHPGKSGLPFPSLQFNGGYSVAALERDGQARGRQFDGLMYFSERNSWDRMMVFPAEHRAFLAAGNLVVVRIPIAPESEGDAMNSKGAQDAYRDRQRQLGAAWAKAGGNTDYLLVSLAWEFNGDWYKWSAKNGGPAVLKKAVENCITNLREGGLDKVNFDMCPNKGPSQSGSDFACIPGPEFVDSVLVDHYDFWGPIRNEAEYQTEMRRSPSFRANRDFARSRGQMWGLAEGGNCHHPAGAGDNPTYWRYIRDFFMDSNNAKDCAAHITYNHAGAPASLAHHWAANPKSYTYYSQKGNFGGR